MTKYRIPDAVETRGSAVRRIPAWALILLLIAGAGTPVWAQSSGRGPIAQLLKQNRLDQAEKRLWTVLTAHPDEVWALDLLGEVRLRQKRNPEAEALFQRVLELSPQDPTACRHLGELYATEGKSDKAIASYETVLSALPGDQASNIALANLYQAVGRFRESLAAVHTVPPASRPPSFLPLLAADYFGLHQPAQVRQLIPSVLRLGPAHLNTALDFVAVLVRNGYVEDGAHILQLVRPRRPNPDYLHMLARVRQTQGKREQALRLMAEAVRLEPRNFELLFDSAHMAAEDNRWKDAAELLYRADDANPDRPQVLSKLTLALLKSHENMHALGVAKRLIAISPDDPEAEYLYVFSTTENGLWEMAEPVARRLVQQKPNDAQTVLTLGIINLRMGKMDEARQNVEKSLQLDPGLPDGHYYRALIWEREGQLDRARKELEDLVQRHPEHTGAQAELGVLELKHGNVQAARTALEQAVKLRPEIAQTHYQLGLVYARLGMQAQARAEMALYQKLRQAEDNQRQHEGRGGSTQAPISDPQF